MSNIERGLMVFLVTVLTLAIIISLLGCGLVQRVAEPIDRAACVATIKRTPDVEFSRYVYKNDACYDVTASGDEILIYQTLP